MYATAEKKALPKSLHTVRILVRIALKQAEERTTGRTPLQAVLYAADVCGYPVVSADDVLIAQAVAQVSKSL